MKCREIDLNKICKTIKKKATYKSYFRSYINISYTFTLNYTNVYMGKQEYWQIESFI